MTIDRWITDAAASIPEKCAIEFCGERLSYGAMAEGAVSATVIGALGMDSIIPTPSFFCLRARGSGRYLSR